MCTNIPSTKYTSCGSISNLKKLWDAAVDDVHSVIEVMFIGSKEELISFISAVTSEVYSNDEFNDAANFESINNNFIDFSEFNPFGEPNA